MISAFKQLAAFISQGDYSLPFRLVDYWYKHVSVWLYQSGAANFDGIMRLPGRLIIMASYGVFGNLFASYFYLALSFIIAGVSFWLFLRYFLNIKNHWLNAVLTLVFVLNPAFLGNTAKIGLVAAAALLPLCLLLIKYFHKTGKFGYIFGFLLCINYSLIHPYNVAVNVIISGVYFVYLLIKDHSNFKQIAWKSVLAIGVAILMNLYFILPLLSVGSVDKSLLSQDLNPPPVDYTNIIDISNAGDPVTAFTLAKHVFLDFNYFTDQTMAIYSIGVIGLYILTIGLFVYRRQTYKKTDVRMIAICLLAALVMILLSSGEWFISDVLMKIVNLPGGWIFRSPLKWQLYVPFFLIAALAIQLKYLAKKPLVWSCIGLIVLLTAQSAVLVKNIYQDLLVPRNVTTFRELAEIGEQKRLLYLSGFECGDYSQKNRAVFSELNQVLSSLQVQMKRAPLADSANIKVTDYDYVLVCRSDGQQLHTLYPSLDSPLSFDHGSFLLYKNSHPQPVMSALGAVYNDDDQRNYSEKQEFIRSVTDQDFYYVSPDDIASQHVSQVFSSLSDSSFNDGVMTVTKEHVRTPAQLVFDERTFALITPGKVRLSAQPFNGAVSYEASKQAELIPDDNQRITFEYDVNSSEYSLQNSLPNGSFEQPIASKVEDCFNFDDDPKIALSQANDGSDGEKSLKLEAGRHIACHGIRDIAVRPGDSLLLSFDYKGQDTRVAGYSVIFNDANVSVKSARPSGFNPDWARYNEVITVPPGATTAKLTLYGYPSTSSDEMITTQYDDVSLIALPRQSQALYMFNGEPAQFDVAQVTAHQDNPSQYSLNVQGAKGELLLRMANSYDPGWKLTTHRLLPFGEAGRHLRINQFDNAWKLNVEEYCQQHTCTKNADGTYDFTLYAVFRPQQFFIIGAFISGLTFVGVVTVLIIGRARRKKEDHYVA